MAESNFRKHKVMIIFIGFIIGAILGLSGAGGSIFAVPLLVLLMDMDVNEAMGLALAAVSASAIIGAYRQRAKISWQTIVPLIIAGVIFAPLGKYTASFLSDLVLVSGFSCVAIVIAIRMFSQATAESSTASHLSASNTQDGFQNNLNAERTFTLPVLITAGIVIGFASGLFGVGGGFLIVPFLMFPRIMSMKQAIACSLATIAFISGSGFISYYLFSGSSDTELLFKVLISAVAGMLLSQNFSQYIDGAKLQKIFSALIVSAVVMLLFKHYRF